MHSDTSKTPPGLHSGLARVAAASTRRRNRMARVLRMTETDVAAIEQLAAMGEVSPARLADLLDLTSGGVAIMLKRLERDGHVARRPHPIDRRRVLVGLSSTTAARFGALVAALSTELDAQLARSSPIPQASVLRLLDDVTHVLEAQAERLDEEASFSEKPPVATVPSLWQ